MSATKNFYEDIIGEVSKKLELDDFVINEIFFSMLNEGEFDFFEHVDALEETGFSRKVLFSETVRVVSYLIFETLLYDPSGEIVIEAYKKLDGIKFPEEAERWRYRASKFLGDFFQLIKREGEKEDSEFNFLLDNKVGKFIEEFFKKCDPRMYLNPATKQLFEI